MTLIENLHLEHKEIIKALHNLLASIRNISSGKSSVMALSKELSALSEIIENHLKFEELEVFPIILEKQRGDGIFDKNQEENQELINRFLDEQRLICQEFKKYINDYTNLDQIINFFDKFLFDSKLIIEKIENIIKKEEDLLFPVFLRNISIIS